MNDVKMSRAFAWLNGTQFLGAFNDNIFKLLVIYFVVSLLGTGAQEEIVAITSIVFVLPFILFSHAGGVLADRYSKRSIIVAAKAGELVIMAVALIGLALQSPVALYGLVFLMCVQSALFGPSKYGIIPELTPTEGLSKANGLLNGFSYLAIILGTFVPTLFLELLFPGNYWALIVFCVIIAGAGFAASLRIEPTPSAGKSRSFSILFPLDIFRTLAWLWKDRFFFLTIIALAYFVFVGSFFQQNLIHYASQYLGLETTKNGYLFPVIALGIALGSYLAGRVSGRNIEIGIVPIGAVGLTVCAVGLYLTPPSMPAALALLFGGGVCSGLFIVPLEAFVQFKAPPDRRGEVLACGSFLGFIGAALAAALLLFMMRILGLRSEQCFLVLGILTAILAVTAVWVLPDFLVRFIGVLVTQCIYSIKVAGLHNVPVSGGVVLVSNHVTWADALFLSATQQRRIRFLMERRIYENRWFSFLFRLMKVIPISRSDGPRDLVKSLQEARKALSEGYMVCIFAEGDLTRNGNMMAFRPGLEKIAGETGLPIVPVFIGNAWGSVLSHFYGRLLGGWPQRIPYPISVIFGEAMPSHSTADQVRQAVQELSTRCFDLQGCLRNRTLPHLFIRQARRRWFHPAIGDTSGKSLTFGRTLAGAVALADTLAPRLEGQDKVGILLPSSVGGVLANLAIGLLGKVAVNINFTVSAQSVSSAIRQCEIRTVISARAFVEKLDGFAVPAGTVMLEDIMPTIGTGARVRALIKAALMPAWLFPGARGSADGLATVIFSSGSTAEPKGIMLSHRNVAANIESFRNVLRLGYSDRICGILPFFHSFGYTVTLWCPLLIGFRVFYHPNPLDGGTIADAVKTHRLTILLTTPTFLLAYIRKATREHFASLRHVVVGAEKLKKRVADSFEERFGIRPLEGYGATELSPVAAVNIPDADIDGLKQPGNKDGSIGHPIPGVAMRVVDMDSGATLEPGKEGLLMVKGPNVMMGYLNNPAKTAEVLLDGWYNTGDVARMDRDGFVYLLDRLSRYSKIGGEMVPHVAVEERYQQAVQTLNQAVFVTAAPDEKKGEQLVIFYTEEAGAPEALHEAMGKTDLPNLWKPKKENYVKLDAVPTLGSGKLDLKRLKDMAREFVDTRPNKLQRTVEKIMEKL